MVTNYGYKIPVLKVVGLNPTGVTIYATSNFNIIHQ